MPIFRRLVLLCFLATAATAAPEVFKARCLDDLVAAVPAILASQDPATGRFGTAPWIVTDQNVLLPLAVAWTYADPKNPFQHRADVLAAIIRGGDALIAAQDATGQWTFNKKDGSTWGQIYMPWTYSRWIRAYQIVHDALSAEERARWDRALMLGFTGIAKTVAGTTQLANIPTHHAMALFFASQVFGRPDWAKISAAFMRRAIGEQNPDGYWSENSGPVINYGFVYLDAIGVYFAASRDPAMIEPLRRAAIFHAHFTYPDGTAVETVDERNSYEAGAVNRSLGLTLTAEGRAHFAHQLTQSKARFTADEAAALLMWGDEGENSTSSEPDRDFDFRLRHGDAAVRRRGPWFLVVSAFTAPPSTPRWIQDRQNLVSIYHERAGLIIGGGNTRLQPRWSNFSAGDITTFYHRPGDEAPVFTPPAGVVHVPTKATLLEGDDVGLKLDYGGRHAEIRLHIVDADTLDFIVSGDPALTAHLTVMPHLASPLRSEQKLANLRTDTVAWADTTAENWIEHGKLRINLPTAVSVDWPVLPHNPYRKDGRAEIGEGRIVLNTAMTGQPKTFLIKIAH
jgi:hypothetical protein